jgi:hypothetical protein
MFSLAGTLVLDRDIVVGEPLGCSGWASGMYVAEIATGAGTVFQKIVVR